MKKSTNSLPEIKKVIPIFFKKCAVCNNKFKFEKGYKVSDIEENSNSIQYFICNDCAKSLKEAENIANIKHEAVIKEINRIPNRDEIMNLKGLLKVVEENDIVLIHIGTNTESLTYHKYNFKYCLQEIASKYLDGVGVLLDAKYEITN